MNLLEAFEQKLVNRTYPALKVGDTVKVYAKIKEGEKERVQVYEGVITRYTKGSSRTALTVRKISFGVGVERTFPMYSPAIDRVEKVMDGKVRRARLYYLRDLRGKAARIEGQWAQESTEDVVKTLGAVASGPVIAKEDEAIKKKTGAAVDALAIESKKA